MNILSRRIQMGNAAEVTARGIDVQIIPEDGGGVGGDGLDEIVTLRYRGLDVVNGDEWSNPDNLAVDDPAFAGWSITREVPDLSGNLVEIVNNLGASWSDAYLVIRISPVGDTTTTPFSFEVSSATIEDAVPPDAGNVVYRYDDILLEYQIVNSNGVYVLQLATTTSGGKRMTSCMASPSMWTVIKSYDDTQSDVITQADSYSYNLDKAMGFSLSLSPIYNGIDLPASEVRDPLRGGSGSYFAFEVEYSA